MSELLKIKEEIKLPSIGYYGKPFFRDPENAEVVTTSWKYHLQSQEKRKIKNFTHLNKSVIQNGVQNHNQLQQYREQYQEQSIVKKGKNYQTYNIPDQSFTFGKANRPPTPINSVIENQYQLEQESRLKKYYQDLMFQKQNQKHTLKFKQTLNTQLLKENSINKLQNLLQLNQPNANQFKMAQFLLVNKKIDSFNNSSAAKQLKDRLQLQKLQNSVNF